MGEVIDNLATLHPDLAGADAGLLNRAFGHTRFVYLRRGDVLAQAVSWLRAEPSRPACGSSLNKPSIRSARGVLDFLGLGLPADREIVAQHRRLADQLNAQWINRYRAEVLER
jgi:trehalose 2-sulfotransferase